MVAIGRKVRFHHTLSSWWNEGSQFGWATSRRHKKLQEHFDIYQWFLTRGGASPQGASINFQGRASPYAPTTWKVWSIK